MRSNGRPINVNSQMEYQRQQERLKAMSSTPDKVKSISADLMIENLLKESTLKSSQSEKFEPQMDIPPWLRCESPVSPPEYRYLWSLVQTPMNMADTQKVSQLLLTSGLNLDVLGHIWNLANRAVPGQLTKQEFYTVLALVNLAQTGVTFNSLNILKVLQMPVIPVLQPDVLRRQHQLPQSQIFSSCDRHQGSINRQFPNSTTHETCYTGNQMTNSTVKMSSAPNYDVFRTYSPGMPERIDFNLDNVGGKTGLLNTSHQAFNSEFTSLSNFPCIGSSPTTDLEDDYSDFQSVMPREPESTAQRLNQDQNDEFTDFQSATLEPVNHFDEVVVVQQKREIPKIPLPRNLTAKFTNIRSTVLKISPESERKLKVLSRNESLSSLPESKISTTNKVSTSISVLGNNHGIGTRLANHTLNIKPNRPKLHKHHKSKSPTPEDSSPSESGDGEIIFGVNTKNFESVIPKCCPKKPTTAFVLKETKINEDSRTTEPSEDGFSSENTRKIQIPMLGTFNETVLPTQTKSHSLSTVPDSTVDLFSVVEDKYSALREIELSAEGPPASIDPANDDFGDFLSADIPPPNPVKVNQDQVEPEDKDNWGEWNCSAGVNMDPPNENSSPVVQNIDRYDPFNLLCLKDEVQAVESASTQPNVTGKESPLLNFSPSSPESSRSPQEENSEVVESSKTIIPSSAGVDNNQTETDLWNLFEAGSGARTSGLLTSGTLTREESLPSLDLKMSSNEESEQETVWRKCLETCQCMIQEGVDVLEGILERDISKEVFAAPKTGDYINGLKIAYEITRRISLNYSDPLPLQEDLNRLWARLEKLSIDQNIQMREDLDSKQDPTAIPCRICLGSAGRDSISHGGQTYHPSCANLWLNCIDGNLPFAS